MNLGNHFELVLFVLLSCVWAHANAEFRIIGGRHIPIESSPHSVAILDNNIKDYSCGGSIVNFKSVLTAAHCVEYKILQNLIVVAGVANIREMDSGRAQRRNVVNRHIDPDHDPQTKYMDVAIVKVDISFSENHAVKIIPLCAVPLKPGSCMHISGWGAENACSKIGSPLLKTTSVQIADTQQIRNVLATYEIYFAETIMYAGRGGEDMGKGDSGAGGVVHEQLCAVAQGFSNSPDYPALYTNVSNPKVREFIIRWM